MSSAVFIETNVLVYAALQPDAGSEAARALMARGGSEKAVLSLNQRPVRAPTIPEDISPRHLLFGRKPNVYRIIHAIDQRDRVVTVLHIRHYSRTRVR